MEMTVPVSLCLSWHEAMTGLRACLASVASLAMGNHEPSSKFLLVYSLESVVFWISKYFQWLRIYWCKGSLCFRVVNRRVLSQGVWAGAGRQEQRSPRPGQHPAASQRDHTREGCILSLPSVFSFRLQMLFDKSNYANFLPCGLNSFFDRMTWRSN